MQDKPEEVSQRKEEKSVPEIQYVSQSDDDYEWGGDEPRHGGHVYGGGTFTEAEEKQHRAAMRRFMEDHKEESKSMAPRTYGRRAE